MSQFIRLSIDEKLILEKTLNNKQKIIEIPDWVPDGKYVAFVNSAVVAVGESPQQVTQEVAEKFPDAAHVIIKRKGVSVESLEYIFTVIPELRCKNYTTYEGRTFPLITVQIGKDKKFKSVQGLPDSAASISLIKKELSQDLNLKTVRQVLVYTARGETKLDVVTATFKINDLIIKTEFVKSEVSEELPFKLLIGRNILDHLNLYLFGKNKLVCYKDP
ncbi:MAG: hypothetical protein HWN67_09830 [Candidatus Helarchaeota archaeon]|nr:hypothetical protein [Candidatus Helarchaeota archaeon]